MMDSQFEKLRGDLDDMQIGLNTVSNNKHVPDIERHIRTMKERTRSTYNMLPFKTMPTQLMADQDGIPQHVLVENDDNNNESEAVGEVVSS
jgi:hypothetical protein